MITSLFGYDIVFVTRPGSSAFSNYNVLYPTYFDPNNTATQPTLFDLEIRNNNQQQAYQIKIIASMEWRSTMLVQGSPITPNQQPLIYGQPLIIHNRDVISNYSANFEVGTSWDEILENNPGFKDLVINTGRFPDGLYVFRFYVEELVTRTQLSDIFTISINLRSPNPITLITPGSPIGFGISKVMDNQPYFVWFSNMNKYILRIWELQHSNYSVQQIEGMKPYYEKNDLLATSFSLPPESALQNNKIYAWQIAGQIETPAMTNPTFEKSNVYLFEISGDLPDYQDNQLLIQLLNQFSAEEVAGLDELIKLLEGGFVLKEEDYQKLMKMFSDGKKVKSITVR
jgi:hypothetical protein